MASVQDFARRVVENIELVIVGKRGGVKKVACTIDEKSGITVIERSLLKLVVPPLPDLPDFPNRPD